MSSPSRRALSSGNRASGAGRGVDRERDEKPDVDAAEVALLDEGDGRHLAVRARHLLDDRAADAPDRDAAPVLGGRGSRRGGANVVLHDPSARPAPAETDQLDAELPGQLPDGRRRPHRRLRVGRYDRDDRLARGLRLLAAVDGAQELLPRFADHHDHGADRCHVALLHQDLEHRPGARRGDLDRRLVGLHLDERLILVHLVALGDEPAGDLGLGEAFSQVRQLELVGHGGAGYSVCPRRPAG